ncbi:hypothetical protein ACQCRO_27390, partial [Ralstonia pseudosolanacearum]|uniref:hypothetical protein n=1 Tax=Ralstonia pseudosolanacearum TaxID=1310165 RepID=UPI003CF20673
MIDVQDARPDSILFSFGISENCTRHEKILQYLMTGSKEAENDGIDYSLLSSLSGIQSSINGMRLLPFVPRSDGAGLYEIGNDESQSSVIYPSDFSAQKQLLGSVADLAHFSKMTVHPDGRILLTGNDFDLKDLMSVFEEFQLNSVKWTKQPMLVPHFPRPDTNESQLNVHGSSLKMETKTFAPMKSPAKIKLKPSSKKRSSRKAGSEKDLCRRSSFHAFESLLSLILDKNRGKTEILSLKKSGTELPQLLTKFSAGIA